MALKYSYGQNRPREHWPREYSVEGICGLGGYRFIGQEGQHRRLRETGGGRSPLPETLSR